MKWFRKKSENEKKIIMLEAQIRLNKQYIIGLQPRIYRSGILRQRMIENVPVSNYDKIDQLRLKNEELRLQIIVLKHSDTKKT